MDHTFPAKIPVTEFSWVSCVAVPTKDNNVVISGSNDKNIKIWKLGSTKSPPTDRHFAQP